jgi:amidase
MGRKDFVPDADATAVARMRAAGAIVLGKTNTPELTLSFETDNLVYGQTNNPYDVSRTPGGSSGGAGAIIASGGSAMDLGTDTGGSIRVPSAFCGLAGLKPTSGRVPRTGHIVPWGLGGLDSLTTIGPMARFVEDLWLAFPIIAGPDGIDPFIHPVPFGDPASVNIAGLRVAFFTDNGTVSPTAEVEASVRSAAATIADSGAEVVEDLPAAITENIDANITSILVADGGAGVRRLVEKAGTEQVHPRLNRFMQAEPISTAEYTALLEHMDAFRSQMLSFMENYDAILSPVRPWPALPHGETLTSEASPANFYTSVFNTTGWPGSVVRVGTSSDGLPISVQVMCRPWREDVAVALATVLEDSLGGYVRPEL